MAKTKKIYIPKVYVGDQMGKENANFHIIWVMWIYPCYFCFIYLVTRKKAKLFKKFGTKSLYIRLHVSLHAVVVNWLHKTNNAKAVNQVQAVEQVPQNQSSESSGLPVRIIQRRASVAGRSLFNVNNVTRETGWDFLPKVDIQNLSGHVVRQNHNENFKTAEMDQEMVSQEAKSGHEIGESSGVLVRSDHEQSKNFETAEMDQEIATQEVPVAHDIGESFGNADHSVREQSENDVESRKFVEQMLKVCNNFQPFLRLPNPPFALNGRRRAKSVGCLSRRP